VLHVPPCCCCTCVMLLLHMMLFTCSHAALSILLLHMLLLKLLLLLLMLKNIDVVLINKYDKVSIMLFTISALEFSKLCSFRPLFFFTFFFTFA